MGFCAHCRWWKPLADAAAAFAGDLAYHAEPEGNDENASAAANTGHDAESSHASRKQAKLLCEGQPFIKAVLHAAALAKVGGLGVAGVALTTQSPWR